MNAFWLASRLDEDQLDTAFQGPLLQSACYELRTVIDSKCRGISELARHILESRTTEMLGYENAASTAQQ
jgi:hypothetical protein